MAQPLLHSAYSMSIPPFTPFTPAAFGRSSSPLNPHASSDAHPPSSSPMTSPTPLPAALGSHYGGYGGYGRAASSEAGPSSLPKPSNPTPTFMSLYTPTSRPKRPSPSSRQSLPSLSLRPTAPGALSSPPGRPKTGTGSPADIFSDPSHTGVGGVGASGTSPLEGQMWRDRLDRRMTERDRRQRARRDDMAERRGTGEGVKEADRRLGLGQRSRTGVRAEVLGGEEDEELERQQAADDEEIYRRLMLLQQRKAAHAALVSFERETGGSDPLLPEFWEDEEFDTPPDPLTPNVHHFHSSYPLEPCSNAARPTHPIQGYNAFETPPRTSSSSRPHLPLRDPRHDTHMSRGGRHADMEAALRAAAEAEAAEAELAEQIEREMAAQMPSRAGSEYGYGVDGDGDGDMDMEGIDWAQVEQMERLALQGQTGQSRGHAERSGASHAGGTDVEMD